MGKKITEENASKWLKENAEHIKLLNWSGDASKVKSKFLDLKRNITFEMEFKNLKYSLNQNPEIFFAATPQEISKKRNKTLKDKYGVDHQSQLSWVQDKIRNTSMKIYGVSHPLSSEKTKKNREKTNIERYGVKNCFELEDIKNKIKSTNVKKYNCENPQQNLEIKNKTEKTNIERYGFKRPSQNKLVSKKISNTKTIHRISGLSLKDIANNLNFSYAYILRSKNRGVKDIESMKHNETILEKLVKESLSKEIIISDKLIDNKFKPDFLLPKHNLVIECDGLYWHSDRINKNKKYHKEKKNFYISKGYSALFFREDEIKNKFNIVNSIIQNKLNNSKRIFARKCNLKLISKIDSKNFFEENHLMGYGSGAAYGLYFNEELIAAAQVRWKNRKLKSLEMSRFCSKAGYSVIGGLGKLISHIENVEQPKVFISFIDLRYGTGDSLKNLGFKFCNEDLSFKWTDFQQTFHRMNFPGNSGYEKGLAKIWDCGQARWEKIVTL